MSLAAAVGMRDKKNGSRDKSSPSPDSKPSQAQLEKVYRAAVFGPGKMNKLIIIGISTGGPKALYDVLPQLPPTLDAGVLIVQHMPAGFTQSLANRLNSYTAVPVKEAEDGEEIKAGCVYIAPGNYHLHVEYRKKGAGNVLCAKLDDGPPRGSHKPSVNELFESVAKQWRGSLVAVIMTGMGNDGTASLRAVKEAGGTIIAEDRSTCVVYGMPRAAIESGYVDVVAPLPQIIEAILNNI
jgi:two-component system chemotaxis response regulator CheB